MAKTLKADKVVKNQFDGEKKPEFQTTWKPKNEDEDEGVFKIKSWTTKRVAEKGDEIALSNLSDILEKAEGQGELSAYE